MAVKIRLARHGAKKNPIYLVVAVDSAKKRDGEYLERLGQYFPKAKSDAEKLKVNLERVNFWQKSGAQVTQTIGQLLVSNSK